MKNSLHFAKSERTFAKSKRLLNNHNLYNSNLFPSHLSKKEI